MATLISGVESVLARRFSRRSLMMQAAGGALAISAAMPLRAILAQSAFDGGTKIDGEPTFAGGTYTTQADGTLYQYAHDETGSVYVNSYDGSGWKGWSAYDDQPSKAQYGVVPVTYDDKGVFYYVDTNGELYEQGWDSYGEATWTNLSGDYGYTAAPHANVYESEIHLYGSANDGYVYHKTYDGAEWGTWKAVNEAPAKAGHKPYSVTWGDHENAFWVGDDGYTYWNRYSYADKAWTGAKQIPSEYGFASTPYAIGYQPESSLYAYGVNADGGAVYNTFDGEGWAGWQAFDASWTAEYAPSAYAYNDEQHVVYTATDGYAYHTTYGEAGWAGSWDDLGENYGYDTQQYEYEGDLYLTYTGKDGGVYTKAYAADGDGTEPTPTPKVKY